jgi:hypothetical protein
MMTIALSLVLSAVAPGKADAIKLHPENPRYFLFRGEPAFLLTSGEHYGGVLNLDFDKTPYLDELKARGFNLTRIFSGTYREVPGSFNIKDNTLAPKRGRFASPWVQVQKPGEPEKFDLDRFDDAYFRRLKAFVQAAGDRGIVVEYVLFCPLYEEGLWAASPMNAANNVNGVGKFPRDEALTRKHPELVKRQLAFVRKAVTELNGFDNVYFEICNEPYFGGVALDWQNRIAKEIAAAEEDLPNRHLIAQNIANGSARVENPDPLVSVFNFHYASPPIAVAENWALSRPIGFDETGFKGTGDAVYRRQAWEFLLSGGAVFSHLDYSFTVDHPDGTAEVVDPTPGGGGPEFRRQLSILKTFIDGLDLTKTRPTVARLLAADGSAKPAIGLDDEGGDVHLLYAGSGPRVKFAIKLRPRAYKVEWIDPATGAVTKSDRLDVHDGRAETPLQSSEFTHDLALRISAGGR